MEIKKPLIAMQSGQTHTAQGVEFVITEDNTFNDIMRWLVEQMDGDKSEVKNLLELLD